VRLITKTLAVAGISTILVSAASVAFAAGTGFTNGDFETDAPGSTITGWTAVNEHIDLGVTQIAGCTSVDTADYTTLRDWAASYDSSVRPESSDPSFYQDNNAYTFDPTLDNFSVTVEDATGISTDFVKTGQVVQLYSYIDDQVPEGYVLHGPAVYSDVFEAKTYSDLSFSWGASDDEDDYQVLGYLLNVDTCEQTEVIDSTGQASPWADVKVAVPSDGNYRFVFVSGTYDESWGGAGGAYLFLDDVTLSTDATREAVYEATLANTGMTSVLPLGLGAMTLAGAGGVLLVMRRRAQR
jgi:LPXTG-motif cell wall-anchored protein